jgi:hypothetical protein
MRNFAKVAIWILIFASGVCFARDNLLTQPAFPRGEKEIHFKSAKLGVNPELSGTVLLNLRSDSLLWVEDFEDGAPDWTSVDLTEMDPFWHLDDWNTFGGTGLSWWMADTTLGTAGGYDNEWYQVLDTDTINLSGKTNPVLTFQHRFFCEPPTGAPDPYNGWDGMNVRVSVDTGKTWTVLSNPAPAYSVTSLYSFGVAHGEGPDVPGWAGSLTTWTGVAFDLSPYTGQLITVRFAFASDPGASTGDGSGDDWFGWQLDDIFVIDGVDTLFSNRGIPNGMTASSNIPIGGNLWHVESGAGYSGVKFADCNDPITGSYLPNMNNAFISPYFWLPDTVEQAFLDFALQGSFTDNDEFPAVDYFGAYVQVKGEQIWRYISNITLDPNGINYVFSDAPANWFWFSQTYPTGLPNLTPLLGDTIRIIFTFESDEDLPMGSAVQIDDVVIWSPITQLAVPTNLNITAGDGYVELLWDDLNVSGHKQLIYDDGSFEDGIFTSSGTFDAGMLFNSLNQAKIDTIWIWGYGNNTGTATTLRVWNVISGIIQSSPLYSKSIVLANNQWNIIDVITDNWMVEGDFVASIEAGTFPNSSIIYIPLDVNSTPSQHSAVNLGGWSTWATTAAGAGLPDGEWGIRAAVSYLNPTSITYNIYRRMEIEELFGDPIAVELTVPAYQDTDVSNGETYCYAVSANHMDEGESSLSAVMCATPQSASIYELSHDDGTAENYFAAGTGNFIAVKFIPDVWPQDVVKAKAFFETGVGSVQFQIWDDDGQNGLPGSTITTVTLPTIQAGWNEIDISGVTISEGNFYVGLRFAPTTTRLGIDNSTLENLSYLRTGTEGAWESFSNFGLGNAMIRCLLDKKDAVSITDIFTPVVEKFELFQNFPNPFNPVTSISFGIPNEYSGERITLKIFDVLGRELVTLVDRMLTAGKYQVQWNAQNAVGEDVTSGIYFFTLQAANNIQTRKMILMR